MKNHPLQLVSDLLLKELDKNPYIDTLQVEDSQMVTAYFCGKAIHDDLFDLEEKIRSILRAPRFKHKTDHKSERFKIIQTQKSFLVCVYSRVMPGYCFYADATLYWDQVSDLSHEKALYSIGLAFTNNGTKSGHALMNLKALEGPLSEAINKPDYQYHINALNTHLKDDIGFVDGRYIPADSLVSVDIIDETAHSFYVHPPKSAPCLIEYEEIEK